MTAEQSAIFAKVQSFVLSGTSEPEFSKGLSLPNTFSARDRQFIQKLASELHLSLTWDEYDDNDVNLVTFRLPEANDSDEEDPESNAAINRVIKKYALMSIISTDPESFDSREEARFQQRLDDWKRTYYRVRSSSLRFLCH